MSFSTTIQFPNEDDHRRLKVLAAVRNEPVGEVLSDLVDRAFRNLNPDQLKELKITNSGLWSAANLGD